jgi:phosphoribosylglycinamide formyltransferase-1
LSAPHRLIAPTRWLCVISNRPDATGLETAAANGIATVALDHKALGSREALDAAMHEALHGA